MRNMGKIQRGNGRTIETKHMTVGYDMKSSRTAIELAFNKFHASNGVHRGSRRIVPNDA
jgi:hypothetical protein